jgi:hypothetical protein
MGKWILNILLSVLVLFFSARIVEVWTTTEPPPPEERAGTAEPSAAVERKSVPRSHPKSHYDVISQKNLFDNNRQAGVPDTPIVAQKAVSESRFARTIALFGVVIDTDDRSALIGFKRSRQYKDKDFWVRVGDSIDQISIVGIESDRIYVREGTSTFEVKLDDRLLPQKRRPRKRIREPIVVTSTKDAKKPTTTDKPSADSSNPEAPPPETETVPEPRTQRDPGNDARGENTPTANQEEKGQ